jgi:putative membrane protein
MCSRLRRGRFNPVIFGKQWIWQNGGGYFGVPYGNFLGWIFTVYVFYQIFALYLSKQDPASVHTVTDKTYWYQVACLLLVIALHFQADFIGLPDKAVTDATGRVWQTGDIYTTGALASIYTLIFASVLGFIKIARMEKTFDA